MPLKIEIKLDSFIHFVLMQTLSREMPVWVPKLDFTLPLSFFMCMFCNLNCELWVCDTKYFCVIP